MAVHNDSRARQAALHNILESIARGDSDQDRRVATVARENLPLATVAPGHRQHPFRLLDDLENAETPRVLLGRGQILEVAYVDGTGEDVPEASSKFSRGFIDKLTKKDPGFQTEASSLMQRIRDKFRSPAKREEVVLDRQARYTLIKQALLRAESEAHVIDGLVNCGYGHTESFDTGYLSLNPREIHKKVTLNDKPGPQAKASRQLLKNFMNNEKVRRHVISLLQEDQDQVNPIPGIRVVYT